MNNTPNMNKQYRDELRTLEKVARKIDRDFDSFLAKKQREINAIDRDITRAGKACQRAGNRIGKRIGILRGRLNS